MNTHSALKAAMAAGTTKTFSDTFFLCHMVYLATTNNKSDPQKSEYQRNPENLNNFRFYYSEERLKSYSKETGAYVLLQAGERDIGAITLQVDGC